MNVREFMQFDTERAYPRVAVWLDSDGMELAHEVALWRDDFTTKGKIGWKTGRESFLTDLQGATSEIAVCGLMDAEFDPIYGRRDYGYDLITPKRGYTIQVKSTPHFHRGVRLFAMPNELRNAQFQVLCSVDAENGYVEVIGIATTERLWSQPLGRVREGLPECRWLKEHQLMPMPVQLQSMS